MTDADLPFAVEPTAQVVADLAAVAAPAEGARPGPLAAMLADPTAPGGRLYPALAAVLLAGLRPLPGGAKGGDAPPPGEGGVPTDAELWSLHAARVKAAPAPVRAAICAGFRMRVLLGRAAEADVPVLRADTLTVPDADLRASLLAIARTLSAQQRDAVIAFATYGAMSFRKAPETAGLAQILETGRSDLSDGWEAVEDTARAPRRPGWPQCLALLQMRALDVAAGGPDLSGIPFIQVSEIWAKEREWLEDLSAPRRAALTAGFRGVFERNLEVVLGGDETDHASAVPWAPPGV